MKTMQDLFLGVWERAKIPVKAYDAKVNICRYQKVGEDGSKMKCFIGAFLTDEQYHPGMDGLEVMTQLGLSDQEIDAALELKRDKYTSSGLRWVMSVAGFDYALEGIINQLQSIHDGKFPSEWEKEIRLFAAINNVTLPDESLADFHVQYFKTHQE